MLCYGFLIFSGGDVIQISAKQILEIRAIATTFENLMCVECAQAIQDYLVSEGIPGKRIKLYTGDAIEWDSRIYDDSVRGDAISLNGRHEGIAIVINGLETVFDGLQGKFFWVYSPIYRTNCFPLRCHIKRNAQGVNMSGAWTSHY